MLQNANQVQNNLVYALLSTKTIRVILQVKQFSKTHAPGMRMFH
jgi:hypothetical protein